MIKKLISIFTLSASAVSPAIASQFTDVSPQNWAYQAIFNLKEKYSCAVGFPNGTFKPGQPATRAELAALTNACLDRITEFYTEADARTAAALRTEFSRELSVINTRVTRLEVRNETKDKGVGSYVGSSVTLQRQGIDGSGKNFNDTVAGASVVGRLPVYTWRNQNAASLRPYVAFAAGPDSQIGSSMGALATFDWSVGKTTLSNGAKISNTNIYLGGGGQWALTNNSQSNFQSSIGTGSQVVFVTGVERRINNQFVAFADLLLPTENSGVTGSAYSPVGRIGLGFKFN